MYDDTRLEEDVLTWINSFSSIEVFVHAFNELSTGVALFKILSEVDDTIWKFRNAKLDNLDDKKIKYQNLTEIFEGLMQFYDENLEISVSNNFIDIEAISEIETYLEGKNDKKNKNKSMNQSLPKLCFTIQSIKAFSPSFSIAKSVTPRVIIDKTHNTHELLKLCEMVIDVTVKCDNKEKFIKQIEDLNEITQIGLMTCIQNVEYYLKQDREKEESMSSFRKEKHSPLIKMLTLNAKSIENISLNQSFTSNEKLDRIMKDSLHEINDGMIEVNGNNLQLGSARTLEDSTEIIEVNLDDQQFKNKIQTLENEIRIYKSNQNELTNRNNEMNEIIKKLMKDKRNFEKLKKKLSSKDSQEKLKIICPEVLKHITELEADLEQNKVSISTLNKENLNLRNQIKEFEEMQLKDEEMGKMYSQELIQKIESLKIKLSNLQNIDNIHEEYKIKLDELADYKNKYDCIVNENELLRSQLNLDVVHNNTEQRYQKLYEATREELSLTKEQLFSSQIDIKKLKSEISELRIDLERHEKNSDKKDSIISHLNMSMEKQNLDQICGPQVSSPLSLNEYEDKIAILEAEVEELKIQNDNYANNEIIKLESILQSQAEQSLKEKKEKNYYEERCSLLEKQNFELKNRIENIKLDYASGRVFKFCKTQDMKEILDKNIQLINKTENLEQKLEFEKSKFTMLKEENEFLKRSLEGLREEKEKLTELLNKNFGILESLNENIKSMESSRIHDNSQFDLDQSDMMSECSRDFGSFKRENDHLKREVMKLKMEVKFHRTVMNLAHKTSPNWVLYSCVTYIKMCYAMYIKAKYTNIIKKSPVKLTPRKK